jgi:uncharacterized protein (TIRG00374 family)
MIARIRPYAKYIAVFITIIFVAILLTQVSLTDVISTIRQINPVYLLAGFAFYSVSYFLRAWRFHILLNNEVATRDLFPVVCVHNMMNNLLPARTGELSYVYLLKKVNNRTTGEGLATLVVARIFDCIALAVLFFTAIFLVRNVPVVILHSLWIICSCITIFIVLLVLLLWYGRPFIMKVEKFMKFLHIDQKHAVRYLLKKGDETVESLDQIHMHHIMVYTVASSFLIWGLNYGMVYLILEGLGFHLPLQYVILGGTFILLTTILPIQGIGGFGTTEMVWTLVFVPLGLSLNDAIISGFCYHIILIFYFVILGIYGWIKLKL